MSIFFTSDTHWNHTNIIKYTNRPYDTVEEMNEALISNWNDTVGPKDVVWHLGDIAWWHKKNGPSLDGILSQLNGEKHLLLGNHDKDLPTDALEKNFVEIANYKELRFNNRKLILCHYPIFSWNGMYKGSWMLHGHCHGNINWANENTTRLDVGVDVHNMAPVSFEGIEEILGDKVFEVVDHHKQREDA
jgi:calcineurin-like phosphoesterase family protein